MSPAAIGTPPSRATGVAVVVSLFTLSACGIAFQLLLVSLSGYLLGETLLLLSAIVGLFLSSMGIGAHLSRRARDPGGDAYVAAGIALGVLGAGAPLAILAWTVSLPSPELVCGLFAVGSGGALGAAIPLAARLVEGSRSLQRLFAVVLAVDYLGALAGSLLLPLAVLPGTGYARGAAILGLAALAAAALAYAALRRTLRFPAVWLGLLCAGALFAGGAVLHGPRLYGSIFEKASRERILYREHSAYQEILLSEGPGGVALRLNGRIQFRDSWERPYHEALVHPPLSMVKAARDVLVLGGGDGLALREILRYPEVRRIVLVDLDPRMTALARRHPLLAKRNRRSFEDRRVSVRHEDAFLYARRATERFDAIIVDLPDPANISLSKLYTVEFYRNVARLLRPEGFLSVQSDEIDTGQGRVLWCITRTLEAAGLYVRPYVLTSLAFNLASRHPFDPDRLTLRLHLGFLTNEMARGLFQIRKDRGPRKVEVNRLETHALLRYFR